VQKLHSLKQCEKNINNITQRKQHKLKPELNNVETCHKSNTFWQGLLQNTLHRCV